MGIQRNRFRREIDSGRGPVDIIDWCDPAFIAGHDLEEGLGSFPSYRSLFTTPEGLARMAQDNFGHVVLGIRRDGKIIGYCILREPDPDDFWGRLGPGIMYEIVGLEVSRNHRQSQLGRILLDFGLTSELIPKRVTYMVGYSWTWDLEGTGLTAGEYRQMLMNLLIPYNFKRYPTNEPNVCLRPENIFMAKIGQEVGADNVSRFKNLLFGLI